MHQLLSLTWGVMLTVVLAGSAQALDKNIRVMPFTLAQQIPSGDLATTIKHTQLRLNKAGFDIIGEYQPYPNAHLFVVTNAQLKAIASQSTYGGFGAALRVSVTQVKSDVQVAHNNPTYLGLAYRMQDDLNSMRQKLASTLGYVQDFGGEGVPAGELPDYNYMGLEGFKGFFELNDYKTHAEAIQAVEKNFASNKHHLGKIYRLDIPGKNQVVYGISMKGDVNNGDAKYINDEYVMEIVDHETLRRSAHLPYELMVHEGRVIAMHPHFRLALNFPDLRMFGEHSFGRLMNLPYAYEEFLVQLAGGKWPRNNIIN